MKIRLRHRCFFCELFKNFWNVFFDAQQEFSKSSQKYRQKMFAKYHSADGFFVNAIVILTVMITTVLSVSWYQGVCFYKVVHEKKFHLKYQGNPFVQQLGLSVLTNVFICKKLKMNLSIALKETSFSKLLRPCKDSCCFQKIVQLFNLMRIMLFA